MLRIFFGGFDLEDLYDITYMIEDAMEKYTLSPYLTAVLNKLLTTIYNHLDHITYER